MFICDQFRLGLTQFNLESITTTPRFGKKHQSPVGSFLRLLMRRGHSRIALNQSEIASPRPQEVSEATLGRRGDLHFKKSKHSDQLVTV